MTESAKTIELKATNGSHPEAPQPDAPDADAPMTRTGIRVRQLVEDVKADLSDIEGVLQEARLRAARLEEEGRGINGLSAACRGWTQQLDKMLHDLEEEREDVERKMLGRGMSISARVNEELHRKIQVARGG